MTERVLPLADGASACPFVAFADDRDERASVPDHRHRCYAETRPAPRALAHQEAYCLSSAFPVCPTFQDWARREAARARDAADAAAVRDAGIASAGAAAGTAAAAADGAAMAGAGATGGDGGDDAVGDAPVAADLAEAGNDDRDDGQDRPIEESGRTRPTADPTRPESDDTGRDPDADEFGARRNPPRDWAAPPPWLASDESAAGGPGGSAPSFLARRSSEPGQGLAGSAADRLAGGPPPLAEPDAEAAAALAAAAAASSARAASAGSGAGASARRHSADDDRSEEESSRVEGQPRRPARRPRAYEQHLGGTDDGPDWERPRRYEAYPTIRTRVGMPNPPRLAIMAGAVLIAAIALLFLPTILGFGNTPGPAASGSPAAGAGTPSPVVTEIPGPTPFIYTIKKNETLLKIASNHGITLEQLLAANPQIKNPNKISEGQQITIPTPSEAPPDQFGGSPSPSAP